MFCVVCHFMQFLKETIFFPCRFVPFFVISLLFLCITDIRKPIRAIRFSVKYDLCVDDRSFDLELLFDFKLLLEVELLFKFELLEVELLFKFELLVQVELPFDLQLLLEFESLI